MEERACIMVVMMAVSVLGGMHGDDGRGGGEACWCRDDPLSSLTLDHSINLPRIYTSLQYQYQTLHTHEQQCELLERDVGVELATMEGVFQA